VFGLEGYPELFFETLSRGTMTRIEREQRHQFPHSGLLRLALHDFFPYYLDNLAALLADAGKVTDADTMFRKALVMNGGSERIRFSYGTYLLENGFHDHALHHLELAIEYGWDDADTWVNRGMALSRLGRLTDARGCFWKALDHDPENRQTRANLKSMETR
jgi:Tfp pilus assembly protein PilF